MSPETYLAVKVAGGVLVAVIAGYGRFRSKRR